MEWYTRASALGFISVFANSACGADAKDPRHVVVLYHVCSASSECEDAAADTPDQIRRPDATFPDVTIVVPPGCGEETVPGWQDYPPCSHGVCMPTEEFPPALHNYLPVDSCDTDQPCAPEYIAKRGTPETSAELKTEAHDCLNLRFPGAPEFQWTLDGPDGPRRVAITGPFESDHGEVLTQWALDGHGIVMKPTFEISDHLSAGRLVPILEGEPPLPIQLACLYMHRRHQDPKVRLFLDFMVDHILAELPST